MLKQYTALQKENGRLKSELDTAQSKNYRRNKKMQRIKTTGKCIKIKCRGNERSRKKEFEKRINGYLKEIERCIALLSE